MEPVFTYFSEENPLRGIACEGPTRRLGLHGRSGTQPLSVHTRLRLDAHTLNADRGAITLWVLPTESLSTTANLAHIHKHDPGCDNYILLSDHKDLRAWTSAHFAWVWSSAWYPQWWAKFFKGGIYPDAYEPVPRAIVTAGHFTFEAWKWVQIALTWDKPAHQYRLYANGVHIASSNQFAPGLEHHPCGRSLYLGDPVFAYGELSFYDACPDASAIEKRYYDAESAPDVSLQKALQRTFAGAEPSSLDWHPDPSWNVRLEHSLTTPDALGLFYVQGCLEAPRATADGMLVETRPRPPAPGEEDRHQVYLWTRDTFEGDIAVEFEFMPTLPNGLSLLMLQASGMHGEDFMADYPLRTTGSMRMVFGEAVRNYHWEFFRGMDDTRNDVASHALIKQPWQQPLAYRCATETLALHTWHTLRFVQTGNRLRGAINGSLVFDVTDGPGSFTGAHYTRGHLAIRCMAKTRNLHRNLRIWTRIPHPGLRILA